MVVIAHPDDAEYGCAGTVAKWCREGMSVVYVVCTDGSKGSADPNVNVGWLIETRQQEQRNACKVLGVEDMVFLNYEYAMLEPTLELPQGHRARNPALPPRCNDLRDADAHPEGSRLHRPPRTTLPQDEAAMAAMFSGSPRATR